MKIKNTKTTIPTIFILVVSLFFFGIIGLTSCEKEEEIKKTESIVIVDQDSTHLDTTDYDYPDSLPDTFIDHKREIITSNWIVLDSEIDWREDIDFFDDNFGVACGSDGVSVTHNGGQTWEFKPIERNIISFKVKTISSTGFCVDSKKIYRSDNAGDSFFLFGRSDSLTRPIVDFHLLSPSTFIVILDQISGADRGKVYITHNGGLNWIEKKGMIGRQLQFINNKIGYISSLTISQTSIAPNRCIYKTIDGGNNWECLNTDLPVHSFYFIDQNIGFFNHNGILYKTTNGGVTWRIISKTLKDYQINDILFIDKNIGYIASQEGIVFRTENGGITWVVDHYSAQSRFSNSHEDYVYTALTKTPNNTVYVTGSVTMKRKNK